MLAVHADQFRQLKGVIDPAARRSRSSARRSAYLPSEITKQDMAKVVE
jgi:hypothetical protein